MNSPLRKKPMNTLYCSSMDITDNDLAKSSHMDPKERPTIYESIAVDESIAGHKTQPIQNRPTIHFDSVAIDESAIGMHANTLSHTIYDSKTINESSSFPNTTASCLAMGHQMGDISMELSICANSHIQQNSQKNSQTIHLPHNGQMEYSLVEDKENHFKQSEIEEMNVSTNIETKNTKKQRESIYTPTDMIEEESPKSSTQTSKVDKTKGLKLRNTILTTEEIVEDTLKDINSKGDLQKTITTPINIFEDSIQIEPRIEKVKNNRQTICQPVSIEEDAILTQKNTQKKSRESIYTPSDMVEESPKPSETKKSSTIGLKLRQTIFTPENIEEDILQPKIVSKEMTINDTMEIEGPKVSNAHEMVPKSTKSRHSVYEPCDMLEEYPNPSQSHGVQISQTQSTSKCLKTRQTICNPEDIIEVSIRQNDAQKMFHETNKIPINIFKDSHQPDPISHSSIKNRQTNFELANVELTSVAPQSTTNLSKGNKSRESIYTPSDMIEDSPKITRSTNVKADLKVRQTIFTTEDIIENPPHKSEIQKSMSHNNRKTIYDAVDIEETTNVIQPGIISNKNYRSRESVYTPIDMLEDEPKSSSQISKVYKTKGFELRQAILTKKAVFADEDPKSDLQKTITTPINIFEDSIQTETKTEEVKNDRQTYYQPVDIKEDTIATQKKSRESIYTPSDMDEESPKPSEIKKSSTIVGLKLRQTIFTPEDIDEDLPKNDRNAFHKNEEYPKPSQSQISQTLSTSKRQTICHPEDVIDDSIKEIDSQKVFEETNKIPINIFEDSYQSKPVSNSYQSKLVSKSSIQNRQTIFEPANIELTSIHPQSIANSFKTNHSRESIYTPSDMIEDSPKFTRTTNVKDESADLKMRQTIFTSENIVEDVSKNDRFGSHKTIIPSNNKVEDSSKVVSNQMKINHTMEIEDPIEFNTNENVPKSTNSRHSVYGPRDMVEEYPKPSQSHEVNISKSLKTRQTICNPENIIEDSIKENDSKKVFEDSYRSEPVSRSFIKNCQTIFDPANIELTSVSPQSTAKINKSRESIYTPSDMIEDSPKLTRPTNEKAESVNLKVRQTIFPKEDIVEDLEHKPQKSISFPPNHRKTIYDAIDIEETTNLNQPGIISTDNNRFRKSVYIPIDMLEESSKVKREAIIQKSIYQTEKKTRESIYTPSDMVEESPKPSETKKSLTVVGSKLRQTIYNTEDIVEDVAEYNRFGFHRSTITSNKKVEDPLKKVSPQMAINDTMEVEDPVVSNLNGNVPKSTNSRQSVYILCDMLEEYPEPSQSNRSQIPQTHITTKSHKIRQTICQPEDIIDDSIKEIDSKPIFDETNKIPNKIFKDCYQSEPVSNSSIKNRQTILEPANIELTSVSPQNNANLYKTNKSRESIYAPSDMVVDSPKFTKPTNEKVDLKVRQTIFTKEDIVEDLPPEPEIKKSISYSHNNRKTIYDAVDIEETTNLIKPGIISNNNNNMPRKSIYTPIDMLEESLDSKKEETMSKPTILKSNDEEEQPVKVVTRPRRVTICEEQQLVDMDESLLPKSTARKSSFSRTLNFNEVSTATTTTSFSKSKFTSEATSQDDVSPIYNPKLRPKVPMTPSSVDRSLAEYLKVEAAIEEQEEDIFYDAEDGLEAEKQINGRQTCHVPVSIFEESGMQPLPQSQSLRRQTTFSPKEMTNQSFDHGQSREVNEDMKSLVQKPTLDSPLKCSFQKKPFESIVSMEVTQANNANNNSKQILMKSRLEEGRGVEFGENPSKTSIQKNRQTLHFDETMNTSVVLMSGTSKQGGVEFGEISSKKNRQTLHFNEPINAGDMSIAWSKQGGAIDFGGNPSNTSVKKNRQTLHFNETMNTSNMSMAINKPSAAGQSIKELLAESSRLFSQSNLMKPSIFETQKRSTMFFAGGKDDSMDVSCNDDAGHTTDPESTPTKNKSSRIPQLIGSAKKLQSLKKSIDFIQQEIPNIGCHFRNNMEEEETPRRFSTTIPKKLQEFKEELSDANEMSSPDVVITKTVTKSPRKEVQQLQQSFDTIEIPRKVLSSVRKTIEEPKPQLKKPHDSNEDYRRTVYVDPPPAAMQEESFETVEIPRRGTTFQRNDTLYICPNEMETTTNASHKSLFQFEEDVPITISDVSTFFSKKLQLNANQVNSPNTTDALCKMQVNEFHGLVRSPDAGDTTHNLADFKKRYVELTCDSLELSDINDAIEKTHLSLVNTLDDESEMVYCPSGIQVVDEITAPSLPVFLPPAVKEPPQRSKPNSSVCRKCKCQRLSTTQQINDTTIGSFMLEPLPIYEIDLSELKQLKKKPNISDVGKIVRQKLRESDSFNVSDGSRSMAMDEEDSESIQILLAELAAERLENTQKIQQNKKEIKVENSFVYKVRRKMESESNWIINELLLFNNIIVLTHTRIRTFAIVINFTPKDPRGVEVIFNDIQFKPNKLHTRQKKPYEYALHYQLLVELPFDLKTICPSSDHFFVFLDHVEKVIQEVLRTGKEMLSIILPSPASLIREPSGRIYIRKYIRTKTPQNDVKRTEVHIEVRNIKKLSYESITMPPLYEFDENIQLLPVGNNFLRTFLNDPMKFLKA
ncbi:uncharacterized protein LOC129913820 isoform X2 [Episyrphus balteatus]|nr:uncharacterized protein LOC129913820 isoform X2 [Episyrphus balteatus]